MKLHHDGTSTLKEKKNKQTNKPYHAVRPHFEPENNMKQFNYITSKEKKV